MKIQASLAIFLLISSGAVRAEQQCGVPTVPYYQLPQAPFPEKLVSKGVSGDAKFKFSVDASGSVRDVEMISTPHPALSKGIIATVKKWRFHPCVMPEGKDVEWLAGGMGFRVD